MQHPSITSCVDLPRSFTKATLMDTGNGAVNLDIDGQRYSPSDIDHVGIYAGAVNARLFEREAKRAGFNTKMIYLANPGSGAEAYHAEMGDEDYSLMDSEAAIEDARERSAAIAREEFRILRDIKCPVCGGTAVEVARIDPTINYAPGDSFSLGVSCTHSCRLDKMFMLFEGDSTEVERVF